MEGRGSRVWLAIKVKRRWFPFRPDADLLRNVLGPAQTSHPEETNRILDEIHGAGVEVVFRRGDCAYSPEVGGPGRLILDEAASIGVVRHEYRHFLDIRAAGYPGLGRYLTDPAEFARLERRGHREEIIIARESGHQVIASAIYHQMRWRIREVLGS